MLIPLNYRDGKRALGLVLLSTLLWLMLQEGWNVTAWQVPAAPPTSPAYMGDELELLTRVKIAQEKGWASLTDSQSPRLGAPWIADWSAYAMPDMPLTILTGKLANQIGLIPAVNTALLLAHVLAVLAFYFCSRTLGHRPVFAAAAALLFGFSYYNCQRSLVHFSLTLSFIVPLILLVVFLTGSSRVIWRRRAWRVVGVAIALWTGLANPYYGLIFIQLLGFALLYRRFTRSGADGLPWWGLSLLGFFFLSLLASNCNAIMALGSDSGSPLERNYAGAEIYGLRFIELFIPPPSHRWFTAATFGHDYATVSALKGEFFSPYLGLVGIGALLLLTADGLRRLATHRFGLRPAHLPLIAWILLYSCTGGLNSLLAFFVTPLFRGTNRFSVVILALVLLALASWATRHGRRRPRPLMLLIALVVTCIGVWDQCPSRHPAEEGNLRAKIESDRQLGQALETGLPPGSLVFQLPVVPFLEQPTINRMTDYDLTRPFLFTHSIRFSYGLLTGSRRLRWQKQVALLPPAAMRTALEAAGFAAVYVQRAAFADSGKALGQQLEQAGLTPLFNAGDHLVYRLHPSLNPIVPKLDDPRLYDAWPAGMAPGSGPTVLVGRGWFGLETNAAHSWRWAGSDAVMLVHNPFPTEQTVELAGRVATIKHSSLNVLLNGATVKSLTRPTGFFHLSLRLVPGYNELRWQVAAPARRVSLTEARQLGLLVSDLKLEVASPP